MTPEEIIEYIEKSIEDDAETDGFGYFVCESQIGNEIIELLKNTSSSLMDKQIPTLVIKHDADGLIYGRCPRCGKIMDDQRYCGNCGQAVVHVSKYGQRVDQDFGKSEY